MVRLNKIERLLAGLIQWKTDHIRVHELEHEAIEIASKDIDRRLGAANALREQIENERGTYVQKDWFESKHKEVEARITNLEEWRWKLVGAIMAAVMFCGIIGWVIGLLIHH